MIEVYISGVTGRVGKVLLDKIIKSKNFSVSGGSASSNNAYIDVDLGNFNETQSLGKKITASIPSNLETDCIVYFSQPESSLNAVKFAAEHNLPILIGTTGFSKSELQEIKVMSNSCPLLLAPNTSLGINLMKDIISKFGDGFKVFSLPVLQEKHHKDKKDSPSGTALYLADQLDSMDLYKENINIESERDGDAAGEHKIIFQREYESIEIVHKASNRSIFADGALEAIKWLVLKKPGLYSMDDIYSSSN